MEKIEKELGSLKQQKKDLKVRLEQEYKVFCHWETKFTKEKHGIRREITADGRKYGIRIYNNRFDRNNANSTWESRYQTTNCGQYLGFDLSAAAE